MKAKNNKKIDYRSQCPISSALDLVGDKWSLLIIRDICFFDKRTFSQFASSDEGIAANILADRLKKLEQFGIITKGKIEGNKKTIIYVLTKKGIDFLPVLAEYIIWADKHLNHHIASEAKTFAESLRQNKEQVIRQLQLGLKKSLG